MALSADSIRRVEMWTSKEFTLTSGQIAYKNGIAVINTAASTGTVLAGAEATTMVILGVFDRYVDASSAAKKVTVNFLREVAVTFFKNDTGTAVAATDVGKVCYLKDDETVSMDSSSRSPAGVVLEVDTVKGVGVDLNPKGGYGLAVTPTITNFTNAVHTHASTAQGGRLTNPWITGFGEALHNHSNAAGGGGVRMASGATLTVTGGTCSLTAANWTHYLIPELGETNTAVVVAAAGTRGDRIAFSVDGALNGTATTTYYSGTYAMTTALTSAKAHLVEAVFDGTNWIFSAYTNES